MPDRTGLDDVIRRALAEDVGSGDVTTRATIRPEARGRGVLLAKAPIVVAGLDVARAVFAQVAGADAVVFTALVADGDRVASGTVLARIEGPAAALLTAERTALNLLQRLSGIATATRAYVDAAAGRITVLDTRKTTPSLRALEKYAVRVGGGSNHRFGLFDLILIKDNHIRLAGGIAPAVAKARAASPGLPVEVEAQTVADASDAAEAGADIILLDNLTTPQIRQAVAIVAGTREDRSVGRRDTGTDSRTGDHRGRFRVGRRPDALGSRRRHLARNRAGRRLVTEIDRAASVPGGLADGLEHARAHGDAVAAWLARASTFPSRRRPTTWPQSWLLQGTPDGTLVVAGQQTAGRGRGGHDWFSPPGSGLYVSMVLDAHQEHSGDWVHALTLATGVAMAEGLHAASGLPVVIKWPNDLVMAPAGTVRGARKLAGILAEAQTDAGTLSHVIVGVGVNVGPAAWPPEISARATSLEEELGRPVDPARGARRLPRAHRHVGAAPARGTIRDRAHAVAATGRGREPARPSRSPMPTARDGASPAASTAMARCSCVTAPKPSGSSAAR